MKDTLKNTKWHQKKETKLFFEKKFAKQNQNMHPERENREKKKHGNDMEIMTKEAK